MEQQTGALDDDDQRRKRTSTRRSRRWRPGAPDPETVTTKARDGGPTGRLIRRRGGRIHRWRRAGQATEGLAPTGNQGGGRGKAQGGAGCGANIGDGGTTVRGGEGGGTRGGGRWRWRKGRRRARGWVGRHFQTLFSPPHFLLKCETCSRSFILPPRFFLDFYALVSISFEPNGIIAFN
jgi:hypothetical protein